ncbi:VOC family protein [Rhodohalobacter sp. 8-1]|uniref:VOC family protein n=1 Tax=Rhodohalobacter sp. 8-1 TaxID=3131972 RepID=UPI0030EEB8C9
MKIEHFAINVSNPVEMTDWYVEHIGLKVVKQEKEAPHTTFLADDGGRVMLEIYNNPPDDVPDYENMDPLIVHVALVSENPVKDKKRLMEAGASFISDDKLEDGSHLVMLRDPWGLPLQLCKRGVSMLT